MRYLSIIKIGFVFIVLVFNAAIVFGQIKRARVVGSYIYNFANKISGTSSNLKSYKIVLLSSNQEIRAEMENSISKKIIRGVPVSLIVAERPTAEIQKAQLVFITRDKLPFFMEVFDMIEGKEILLVSEGFENKSYVMINLYNTPEGAVRYEINKPNIQNQHLNIDDEVLLMGGTEIDIAAIYLKSQHSLRAMEKKLAASSQLLDSLRQNIKDSKAHIREQNQLIGSHKETLKDQGLILQEQMHQIRDYRKAVSNYLRKLDTARILLASMQDSLTNNALLLQAQKTEILGSRNVLQQQKTLIDSINNEIAYRNLVLENKESVIGKQKNQLEILFVIVIVILSLVVWLVLVFRQSRRKSKRIFRQSVEIEAINMELNTNNEELTTTLEKLKQMQKQLVQSEKMASLGLLSAGIAHEINNPINFVYAGINSLLRDFQDIEPVIKEINNIDTEKDDVKEKLKKIQQLKEEYYFDDAFEAIPEIISDIKLGADRTSEIVKSLRSFSRLDKGVLQGLNVHEGLDTSLLLLRNRYKNDVEIVKNYDKNIPEIECYPGKINQVFLNVLSNAIDAIEGEGKIFITTKSDREEISVSIKDTGVGMDEETIKKLFDPFFTTKPVGQGTGLGLSISYGIIHEHNGTIKVQSEVGKGCEFIITLPVVKQEVLNKEL